MSDKQTDVVKHFSAVSENYCRHRPSYPAELAEALAGMVAEHILAVDVGCGNGQLSVLLARYFEKVIATDASADQIANAIVNKRVDYRHETAEALSLRDRSVNLIVAAQAAHWFSLPVFYEEVRRIAAPDAVIALVSYGIMKIAHKRINTRLQHYYWQEIHPFWPAERRHVENGYTDIIFPFLEKPASEISITREWNLSMLLAYIKTWSATANAQKQGAGKLFSYFEKDMKVLWGNTEEKRSITWPVSMRVGQVFP